MPDRRRDDISARLDDVRRRIERAAGESGRAGQDITLVVITKTWPVSDVEILLDLGIHDIGENKHQDAREKVDALAGRDVRWHFVGQIQSNKASKIVEYADVVHSVDSIRVAQRLNSGAHRNDRQVSCFVQINLDATPDRQGRGGILPAQIDDVAGAIETAGRLSLLGVMGVASASGDPARDYRRLLELSRELQHGYPAASAVSAGMSGDFETAIRAGATHVRVGSAVLGQRRSNE